MTKLTPARTEFDPTQLANQLNSTKEAAIDALTTPDLAEMKQFTKAISPEKYAEILLTTAQFAGKPSGAMDMALNAVTLFLGGMLLGAKMQYQSTQQSKAEKAE